MVTFKEAELQVLGLLLDHIDSAYKIYENDKYAVKYVKALNKFGSMLNLKYRRIDDRLRPTEGEA